MLEPLSASGMTFDILKRFVWSLKKKKGKICIIEESYYVVNIFI